MESAQTKEGWVSDVQVAQLVGEPVEWVWMYAMAGSMPSPDIVAFKDGRFVLVWRVGRIDRWFLCGTPTQ